MIASPSVLPQPFEAGNTTPVAGGFGDGGAEPMLLEAREIRVRRGYESLFAPVSFTLRAGQMLWLRGPNGCGKTSLLRVVAGLARPDAGQLLWPGAQALEPVHRPMVYLGHHNGLKDDLTALECLQFLAALHGQGSSLAQAEAALRVLGVFHRRHLPVRMLSQGQRKRVALARLVLETQPGLWVLDEPLDALDDGAIATVQRLLQTHTNRGGAVLLTSHIPLSLDGTQPRTLVLQKTRQPGAAAQ